MPRRLRTYSQLRRGNQPSGRYKRESMRKRGHSREWQDKIRPAVLKRDLWTCKLCGHVIDSTLAWPDPMSGVVDHIVPVSRGGQSTMANAQAAHAICNARKSAKSGEI